ncbi:hypothetical protein L3Q82_002954 [Scortum barcoo]|uniref:Uncharacterized protein n=1 Tax=Scortum barcoo TaxID=214431 RepID=A0ACB8VQR6_9TELE|nr:hypothetical protein L3Q82_002954 [Scortum barcoo]
MVFLSHMICSPVLCGIQRQQKIQRDRLMNDFSAALNNFQAVQRRTAEKEKESVARARAGSRLSTEDGARDEKLVSFDNQEDWGQMTTQTEEVAITEEDLELIKERETNIRQLESDIMDVNQIFKDLAVMIHDQGEMIDSIEANVENAEVHVERGTEQLQRAAYYQQKSRKKMCILAMVCSIVLIILGIIIWQAANTIWPFKMDPAHASSPESRLERIEQTLRLHEARFAMAATEIQQATTTQAEGLAALTSQVQQLMAAFTMATAAASPLPPPALAPAPPGPVLEPWVGNPERYAGGLRSCSL